MKIKYLEVLKYIHLYIRKHNLKNKYLFLKEKIKYFTMNIFLIKQLRKQ